MEKLPDRCQTIIGQQCNNQVTVVGRQLESVWALDDCIVLFDGCLTAIARSLDKCRKAVGRLSEGPQMIIEVCDSSHRNGCRTVNGTAAAIGRPSDSGRTAARRALEVPRKTA